MKQKPVGIKSTIKSWFAKRPKSKLALVWMHIYHDEDHGIIGHCAFDRHKAIKGKDNFRRAYER
jgi:hypothetical protein